jgi:hypothetical protein
MISSINWTVIFNRLFEIIDQQGPNYFSGPRFLRFVKELDPYFPDYYQYIEQRKGENKSTTRKNYFYDLLLSFEEEKRVRLTKRILQETRAHNPTKVAELYSILGGDRLDRLLTYQKPSGTPTGLIGFLTISTNPLQPPITNGQ